VRAFSSTTAIIDEIVVAAPWREQRCLMRRYLYRQPDRAAAQDMRISKTRYRQECERALEYVSERLAERSSSKMIARKRTVAV